jgi:predicted N-acetyltransferase YhbS
MPALLNEILEERPEDVTPIREITTAAFKDAEHSSGMEAAIVETFQPGRSGDRSALFSAPSFKAPQSHFMPT